MITILDQLYESAETSNNFSELWEITVYQVRPNIFKLKDQMTGIIRDQILVKEELFKMVIDFFSENFKVSNPPKETTTTILPIQIIKPMQLAQR